MFLETNQPLALAEAGLHGLSASLNSPVINIEDMRVGPARAAILVFADERGGIGLAVGLRSLENAQVKIFLYRGDLDPMASPDSTMESALSFAEGMGFLFDEDMVGKGPAGRVRALRHWQELVGDSTQPGAEGGFTLPPNGQLEAEHEFIEGDEELLLDEEVLSSLEIGDGGGATVAGDEELSYAQEDLDAEVPPSLAMEEPPQRPTPEPQVHVRLSKFRGRSAEAVEAAPAATPASRPRRRTAAESAEESSGGNELGRISLVQVRLGGAGDKPSALARLLGSF